MTKEEFKEYLDMIVERAFKEGIVYARNRALYNDDVISIDEAIENAKRNILGE